MDPNGQKVAIFVDSSNVYHGARAIFSGHFDYFKLIEYCQKLGQIVFQKAYVVDDSYTAKFINVLKKINFEISQKTLKVFVNSNRKGTFIRSKGNFDVEITTDLLLAFKKFDIICLVTSDGDFSYVIEKIREIEKNEIVSGQRKKPIIFYIMGFQLSSDYRNLNDTNVILITLTSEFSTPIIKENGINP